MGNNFIFQDQLADLSVCDKIIEYHVNGNQYFGQSSGGVNKDKKDSIDVVLQMDSYLYDDYTNQLKLVIDKFIEKYPRSANTASWGLVEQVQIQKYPPLGGYHVYHCERTTGKHPICNRHLVFMTYLNDVNDKGQTEFLYQDVAIEPKKGLTLVWPVDWTHTHRGIPSPSQTKYIVTGWLSFLN